MDSQFQLQPPPETLIKPLLEMREHYAREVTRCDRLLKQALENLHHAEALLSAWSMNIDATSSIADEEENSTAPQIQTISSSSNTPPTLPQESLSNSTDDITQLSLSTEQTDIEQTNSSSVEQTTSQSTINTDQQNSPDDQTHSVTSSFAYPDVPMLPELQHLTRPEAILKLLQEHQGTVCHIDFITLKLYGELNPNVFKVVKARVQSTLTQGKESNKWFAVPGQPGCYTLVLSLIPASGGSSLKRNNFNKKVSPQPSSYVIPMLESYKGQFLIDALTSLFKENSGKVFNVTEVIEALYGKLNKEDFREVKPKVLNELSRGYRTGRFSKLPEKIGLYTWDANLIKETS